MVKGVRVKNAEPKRDGSIPSGCGKKNYPSQASARLALDRILRKQSLDATRAPKRVYPCDSCDGWHLTSKPLSGKVPPWDTDPDWTRPDPGVVIGRDHGLLSGAGRPQPLHPGRDRPGKMRSSRNES